MYPKNHTVSIDDLKNYNFSREIAGQYGRGKSKSINAFCSLKDSSISYQIFHNGEELCRELSLEDAIKEYNQIT